MRGTSPVGGSVQCGRSAAAAAGSVGAARGRLARPAGLATAVDGSLSSASGKLTCGRGPSGGGGHVAEPRLVVGALARRLPGLDGCLGLLGPDDAHALGRRTRRLPDLDLVFLVHIAVAHVTPP